MRIVRRPERRRGIRISDAGVRRMLRRNGLDRLPRGARLRKVRAGRCNRQVPGRRLRTDVKFPTFKGKDGRKTRRFQFAAIDDATRGRALKIYDRRTRANAVPFVDRAIETFPFRIREIRADDGHEFQAKFRRRVEDQGVRHACVKPRSPRLDGKVERSHGSDEQELRQRLNYKGDVDLEAKLEERERVHNLARPHGAHGGKPPYEALREKL